MGWRATEWSKHPNKERKEGNKDGEVAKKGVKT